MIELKQVETENKQIVYDMEQLVEIEESRLSVITAIFARINNEIRLQNIQDIKKDISYGARDFGQLPEKYVASMDSIVRSYIQETNEFMKAYNNQFMNIQNILKSAEERQKYYFLKIRKIIVMKKICALAGKEENEYKELDGKIKAYRKKLGVFEKIIMKCDKEFEECKNRREQDFKELFEIKQEQSLTIIKKVNLFYIIISKLKNKFKGYKNFSKFVLQKHAGKLNRIKTETMKMYVNKIKKDGNSFSEEIEDMLENL